MTSRLLRQLAAGAPTLNELFHQDPQRANNYRVSAAGIHLDYSKNFIDETSKQALLGWAQQANFTHWRTALYRGEPVNNTEHRPALHTALRQQDDTNIYVDGHNIIPAIRDCQSQMASIVQALHDGTWRGFGGRRITDVVNIGIGGSDLGPRLVVDALRAFAQQQASVHFVANVDPEDIETTLAPLNPQTTLIIVASKTFTTQETLANAHRARQWLTSQLGSNLATGRHFIAITANRQRAIDWGIEAQNCLPLWDWVGGRYSLWSAIGLPIAIALGMANFQALLAGAADMDKHFFTEHPKDNMPVIAALIDCWYRDCWQISSQAIIPYAQRLQHLPAYLQQAVMESNGKRVQRDGTDAPAATSPVIWGGVGTNGQHAFHQLLHQGSDMIPVDFILPLHSAQDNPDQQKSLLANCLAQSQALMQGKSEQCAYQELLAAGACPQTAAALAPHKAVPGNKPSNIIYFDRLTPANLGALLAFYEHRIFSQSIIWQINPFDQWGVELGKSLSSPILAALKDPFAQVEADSSTKKMVDIIRNQL